MSGRKWSGVSAGVPGKGGGKGPGKGGTTKGGGAGGGASKGGRKRKAPQCQQDGQETPKKVGAKEVAEQEPTSPAAGPSKTPPEGPKKKDRPPLLEPSEAEASDDEVRSVWDSEDGEEDGSSSSDEDVSDGEELGTVRQRWAKWEDTVDESVPPPPVPIVPTPLPDRVELGLDEGYSEAEYQRQLAAYRKLETHIRHRQVRAGVNWRRKQQAVATALDKVTDQVLARTNQLGRTTEEQAAAAGEALHRLQRQLLRPEHRPADPSAELPTDAPLVANEWSWNVDSKTTYHHPFTQKTGPVFPGYRTPAQLLELFVGPNAVRIIVQATNQRLQERLERLKKSQEKSGKDWKSNLEKDHEPLTESEFWKLQAVLIYISQTRLRTWESHWRKEESPGLLPSSNFSKRRFEALYLSLSCAPRPQPGQKHQLEAHHHVQELTIALVRQWRRQYNPPAEISCDECLVKFTGRFKHKQTIPSKPAGQGLKFYVLASSDGVVLNLFLSTVDRQLPGAEQLGTVPSIVLKLLSGIPQDHNYFHKGHRLFVDNFYSSVTLFR